MAEQKQPFIFERLLPLTREEIDEIEVYLQDKNFEKNENPLLFWKANSLKYHVLSKLAKRLLGIPATSAPIERVFSHAGNILRPNCARLLPDNFE